MKDVSLHGNLSPEEWQDLLTRLRTNNIDRLFLDFVTDPGPLELSEDEANSLAAALRANSSLSELTLKGCVFEDSLGEILISLIRHPKLTLLTVRNYTECAGGIDSAFVSALSSLLFFNKKLTSLVLERSELAVDFSPVCSAIASSESLTGISFIDMKFSLENQNRVLNAIAANQALTKIIFASDAPVLTEKMQKVLFKRELKEDELALLKDYLTDRRYWDQFAGVLNSFPPGIKEMQPCWDDLAEMKRIVGREEKAGPGLFGKKEHDVTTSFYRQVKQAQSLRDLVSWIRGHNYNFSKSP